MAVSFQQSIPLTPKGLVEHPQEAPVTPSNTKTKQKKRIRASPPSPIKEIAQLTPILLDIVLGCFVTDIERPMTWEDAAAMGRLPQELRNHLLPLSKMPLLSFSSQSASSNHSADEPFCGVHNQLCTKLVMSLYSSLYNLIFYLPAPMMPDVQPTRFLMTIVGMRAVIDPEYRSIGWMDSDVYESCIGCRCCRLLSEESFVYTLLVALACQDEPDEDFRFVLEQAYRLLLGGIEGYTTYGISTLIQSAKGEARRLKESMAQKDIEVEYFAE